MKKMQLACFVIFACAYNAQVKIGDNAQIAVDDSEALRVESTSKGVLIPNVSIPNLNQAPPVTSPADYLMVYNTNVSTTKGFHYWKDNKWNAFLDTNNVYEKLKVVKSYSVQSTGVVTDNTLNNPVTYNMDDAPSANDWQLIPGVSKTINIINPNNYVNIDVNGIIQTNLSNANDSYAIAIFVDGKLKGTRGFVLYSSSSCAYDTFNVQTLIEDLPVGNHTFEIRETYRNNLRGGTDATLAFGGKSTSCSNVNDDMARTDMNIQIVQK